MIPLFAIDKLDVYIDQMATSFVDYIPSIIKALAILIGGIILIKVFRRIMTKLMTSREMDPTFLKFVLDLCTWLFRLMIIIAIIDQLGIKTTSFMAVLGAAGIAVGLSLQGALSNFSGGLLIILFKPFRVGDTIEAQGQSGTVNSIQIFSTRIITSNNQVVYLPNGTLSNNTIKNFSQEPLRRGEINLSVAYTSNLKEVREVLQQVIESDPKILTTPAPGIEIRDLGENSVNLTVHIWAERANHGAMVSDFYENTKIAFEKANIEIPFPQRNVYLMSGEKVI